MKKLIVGLTLTAGLAVNAQTSATTLPAAQAPAPAAANATAAPAVQTLTTTEADPGIAAKFGATFYSENSMGVKEQKELKDKAGVTTAWTMGIKYKPTKKISVELQQLATTRSNFEGDVDKVVFNKGERQVMGDMVVKGGLSTDLTLLGSEAIAFGARYYLPTSQVTREVLKRNGTLRFDVNPSWVLNPSWTFDLVNSPRIIYNNNADSAVGSDTVYRYVGGPSITYNLNDKFNAYYIPYVDIRSANVSRGTASTEALNNMYHEAGVNVVLGPLTINPAVETAVNLNDSSASIATADSRVFADENMSYLLNFYASF